MTDNEQATSVIAALSGQAQCRFCKEWMIADHIYTTTNPIDWTQKILCCSECWFRLYG